MILFSMACRAYSSTAKFSKQNNGKFDVNLKQVISRTSGLGGLDIALATSWRLPRVAAPGTAHGMLRGAKTFNAGLDGPMGRCIAWKCMLPCACDLRSAISRLLSPEVEAYQGTQAPKDDVFVVARGDVSKFSTGEEIILSSHAAQGSPTRRHVDHTLTPVDL